MNKEKVVLECGCEREFIVSMNKWIWDYCEEHDEDINNFEKFTRPTKMNIKLTD